MRARTESRASPRVRWRRRSALGRTARIDAAGRYAPLEQLALSPQCGFSSGIGGNAMTVEDEIAKLRLVVETAREVWGSA